MLFLSFIYVLSTLLSSLHCSLSPPLHLLYSYSLSSLHASFFLSHPTKLVISLSLSLHSSMSLFDITFFSFSPTTTQPRPPPPMQTFPFFTFHFCCSFLNCKTHTLPPSTTCTNFIFHITLFSSSFTTALPPCIPFSVCPSLLPLTWAACDSVVAPFSSSPGPAAQCGL